MGNRKLISVNFVKTDSRRQNHANVENLMTGLQLTGYFGGLRPAVQVGKECGSLFPKLRNGYSLWALQVAPMYEVLGILIHKEE